MEPVAEGPALVSEGGHPGVLQEDGGSEFQSTFEQACQQRGLHLFVLPPRSPKLNGHVERAHRTHAEEFYEVSDLCWTVADVNRQALAWERVYNTVRPHQALAYKTPKQFLEEFPDLSGHPP